MDNITFGTIMTLVGMGGTLVSLWLITLVISLMKRLFPAAAKPIKEVSK